MSLVSDMWAQIADLYKQIEEVQDQCSHPKVACAIYEGSVSESVWEDDDYIGHFVTVYHPVKNYTCGLCGYKWQERANE